MHAPAHKTARRSRGSALAWIVAIAAMPSLAFAQTDTFKTALQFEARVDALAGPPAGGQLGVGANVAAGYYVRIGLYAAEIGRAHV